MNFKELSFQNKNKLLYLATLLLLIVCWVFSFSKTWDSYSKSKSLLNKSLKEDFTHSSHTSLEHKNVMLDSLVQMYTLDSLTFYTNFLYNISLSINDLPLLLKYDINNITHTEEKDVLTNSIILQGDYKSILIAIQRIEKLYFISRIQFTDNLYTIECKMLK